MKEHPILFSSSMIQAILAGRKTQTRRIFTPHPAVVANADLSEELVRYGWHPGKKKIASGTLGPAGTHHFGLAPSTHGVLLKVCPYGVIGDQLWVKETHTFLDSDFRPTKMKAQGHVQVSYRADHSVDQVHGDGPDKLTWRPSIFMPRWASRITLKITEVRVERLNDISEADAKAEGVTPRRTHEDCWSDGTHRSAFEFLWGEINGWEGQPKARAPWATNPFVWVLSFRKI